MIQDIYFDKYDWSVRIYYIIEDYPDSILLDLQDLGCPEEEMMRAKYNITSKYKNAGFIFSNPIYKESLIVIGPTDSAEEFQNTLDHEKGHLATHIALYYDINPYGEEFQYLNGTIGREIFKQAKFLMCDECRNKIITASEGV